MTASPRTVFLTVALFCSCLLFSTTTSAATSPTVLAENNGIFVSTFYNIYDYIFSSGNEKFRNSSLVVNTLVVDDDMQCPGATYSTIQAATDAATDGDTIKVCAGTYNESVSVTKSLTINGPQVGIDARTRSTTDEAVVGGTQTNAFNITGTPTVTINGFTISTTTAINDNPAVFLQSGSGHIVSNNIFTSSVRRASYFSSPNTTFQNNRVSSSYDGFFGGVNNTIIQNNLFDGTFDSNSGTAVNTTTSSAVTPANNYKILNNQFTSPVGNFAVVFATSNSLIDGNTVTGAAFSAVFVGGGNSALTISNNTIKNGTSNAVSFGGGFGYNPDANIAVTSNNLEGNRRGIRINTPSADTTTGIVVNFNRIKGNINNGVSSGIVNDSTTVAVNAENNFFGCNTGAGTTGCDSVIGTVDADPFAILDVSASPAIVTNRGVSTITAKFISSDAANTNTLPLPNGILVNFSGAVMANNVPLNNGTATVTYTDTSSFGDQPPVTIIGTTDNASDDATVTVVDTTPPTVSTITRGGANQSTMASSVNFTVTFSEPVTGVDTADFTVRKTGNLGGGTVSNVSGSGTTYIVTVSGISATNGNGTIGLNVSSSGTEIVDGKNNELNAGFTGGETYTVLMTGTPTANCPTGRQTYDAASQFSLGGNPNCAYTYGNTASPSSNTVLTYRDAIVGAFSTPGIDGWYTEPFNSDGFPIPGIFKNNNTSTTNYLTIVQPAGSLALHPGKNGERSVLRFTVPTGGTGFYNINGQFTGIDNGGNNNAGTTTDVSILVNGVSIFSGSVDNFGDTEPFSFPRNLNALDTVDFSVGYGTGANPTYSNDSTGLAATFTPINAPQAETLYGLSGTTGSQTLVMLDSANPNAATSIGTIDGLPSGVTLVGIDFRPATGQIYGLGSDGAGNGSLFVVNSITGPLQARTVTRVGTTPIPLGNATQFGFDFNPTVDRIRVVSNSTTGNSNFRLNPNNGAIVTTAPTDVPLNGGTNNPKITAAAYTSNRSNATATTLYDIDSANDTLYTQGTAAGVMPVDSPNNGTLRNPVPLNNGMNMPVDVPEVNGFDISGLTSVAYVSFGNQLYTLDLGTGVVSPVGAIGTFTNFTGLTAAPVDVAPIVRSINRVAGAQNPTNGSTVQFLVTFSEPVTGVDTTDFQINTSNGGQVGYSGQPVQQADPNTYIVTLSVGTVPQQGTDIRLDLIDDDTIRDASNTPLGGAGNGNGSRTGDQIYSIDKVSPTVTINQTGQADPTDARTVNFTAVFSESVTGFTSSDVVLDGTCTGGVANVTGSGTTYNVEVSNLTLPANATTCTITARIPANAAQDSATNGNTISQSTDNSVTYAPSTISISDESVTEGGTATFTVTVTPASGVTTRTQTVTVNYATADGTAISPDDYTAANGTLTFGTGTAMQTFTVATADDALFEGTEGFVVNLSNAVNGLITDPQGTGTITDSDFTPTASITKDAPAAVAEGNNGTTNSTFTVSLSNPSTQPTTVTVTAGATAGDTATLGEDYSFGTTTQYTNIALGKTATQSSTGFGGDPIRAIDGNTDGVYGDGSVSHTGATFDVTSDPGTTLPTGELRPYWDLNLGTSQPIDHLNIFNRTDCCSDRLSRFYIFVSDNPFDETSNGTASIAASQNRGDVSTYYVAQSGLGVTQFVKGIGRNGQYIRIQLDSTDPNYPTGGAIPASGTFLSLAEVQVMSPIVSTQTVVIPAGSTTATVTALINGDTKFETDETFTLSISLPTSPAFKSQYIVAADSATATITNEDALPTVSINPTSNVSVTEGDSRTFDVRLLNQSYQPVTVNVGVTGDVSANDYTISSTTLTFAPGEVLKQITFTTVADATDEPDEAFSINLTSAINATIANGTATGTIVDNDATPTASISTTSNPASVTEGNSGTQTATFTVSLSGASNNDVTVSVTPGGTADSTDFTLSPLTITFPAGSTTAQTVTATINGDTTVEPDETFTATIAITSGTATLGNATGTGTITNDDNYGTLQFSAPTYSVTEGTANASVTVTRTDGTAQSVSAVCSTVTGGTATAGSDYTTTAQTITFADGDNTPKTCLIPINNDTLSEVDETVNLALTIPAGSNATLGTQSTSTLTIVDNDGNGQVSISGTIAQNNVGLDGVTVTLTGSSSQTTTTANGGKYSFTVNGNMITPNNGYVVTPSFSGKVFEPTSRSYNNLSASVTNADFIAYDANNIPRVVTIANAYTNPGQAVTIPIIVDSLGNENTFTFTLDYDSTRLTGTPTVACGTQATGCTFTTNTMVANKLGILVDLATPFQAGTRNQLITVTFSTTSGTAQTNVTFDQSGRSISDDNTNGLPASYVNGFVAFSGFESDLAARFGGDGRVLPNDVVLVRQFVAGTLAFNPNFDEFRRTDSAPRGSFGDGCLKANDVVQARRYSVGLDPLTAVDGPATQSSQAICDPTSFADNAKTRNGDVIAAPRNIFVASTTVPTNASTVTVPIRIDAIGDEAVVQFSISYNTTQLSNPRLTLGSASTGATLLSNPQQSQTANGSLGILIDFGNGTLAAGQNRNLISVTFDITAPAGSSTITFGSMPTIRSVSNQNADELPTSYASGTVTKSATTAAGAKVGGRVTTSNGKGLVGAIVSMTDANGVIRTTRTTLGGRYEFADVPTGATYIVSAASKRYTFEAQPQSISEDRNDINFAAMP